MQLHKDRMKPLRTPVLDLANATRLLALGTICAMLADACPNLWTLYLVGISPLRLNKAYHQPSDDENASVESDDRGWSMRCLKQELLREEAQAAHVEEDILLMGRELGKAKQQGLIRAELELVVTSMEELGWSLPVRED